jgi:hypothetical protein
MGDDKLTGLGEEERKEELIGEPIELFIELGEKIVEDA